MGPTYLDIKCGCSSTCLSFPSYCFPLVFVYCVFWVLILCSHALMLSTRLRDIQRATAVTLFKEADKRHLQKPVTAWKMALHSRAAFSAVASTPPSPKPLSHGPFTHLSLWIHDQISRQAAGVDLQPMGPGAQGGDEAHAWREDQLGALAAHDLAHHRRRHVLGLQQHLRRFLP